MTLEHTSLQDRKGQNTTEQDTIEQRLKSLDMPTGKAIQNNTAENTTVPKRIVQNTTEQDNAS